MTKSTFCIYFVNEDDKIHSAKPVSPTPMTKYTPKQIPHAIYFKMNPY